MLPKESGYPHFVPFKDFFSISYIEYRPGIGHLFVYQTRDFFRSLFRKEKWSYFIREQLLSVHEPNHVKALSVAFGVFMGILPIWGFQLVTAIFLSFLFRLNKAIVIICSQHQHSTNGTAYYICQLQNR